MGKSKYLIRMFMLSIAAALILSACSDSESGDKASNDDQTIKIRMNDDPDFLDPHLATASISFQMILNMFEGLVASKTDGTIEPVVAEEYDVSEDGLTYTFKLRDDVMFHNGEPVTIDDVQYTFDRLMGTTDGQQYSSEFEQVESIETPDDKTIVFTLKEANSNFLFSLTALHAAIIPKSNEGQHNEHPIGTGPFKFVSYNPGANLVLEKHDQYWVKDLPYLNQVDFIFQPDDQAALLALQAGELDLSGVKANRIPEVENDFKLNYQDNNSSLVITFNQDKEPFNNVKVRQAINYAVSRQDIIDSVYSGYATKLGSNMSPAMGEYYRDGLQDVYNQDMEKAKALLKEAGYPDGFKTKITVSSHNTMYADLAQVAVENLREIGIDAEIEVVEWGIWLERVYKGKEYEITAIDLTGRPSAYEILNDYISTNSSENFFNFKNEEFDKVMKNVLVETDQEKRIDLYKRAQEILNEEAVAVYIADYQLIWAMDKNLEGQKMYPFWFHDMSEMKFTE